jgi:hypothetical protein
MLTTAALTVAATAAKSTPPGGRLTGSGSTADPADGSRGDLDAAGGAGLGATPRGGRVPATTRPSRKLTIAVKPMNAPAWRFMDSL